MIWQSSNSVNWNRSKEESIGFRTCYNFISLENTETPLPLTDFKFNRFLIKALFTFCQNMRNIHWTPRKLDTNIRLIHVDLKAALPMLNVYNLKIMTLLYYIKKIHLGIGNRLLKIPRYITSKSLGLVSSKYIIKDRSFLIFVSMKRDLMSSVAELKEIFICTVYIIIWRKLKSMSINDLQFVAKKVSFYKKGYTVSFYKKGYTKTMGLRVKEIWRKFRNLFYFIQPSPFAVNEMLSKNSKSCSS